MTTKRKKKCQPRDLVAEWLERAPGNYAILDKDGVGVYFLLNERNAKKIVKHWDKSMPSNAPHRAVRVLEFDPEELFKVFRRAQRGGFMTDAESEYIDGFETATNEILEILGLFDEFDKRMEREGK